MIRQKREVRQIDTNITKITPVIDYNGEIIKDYYISTTGDIYKATDKDGEYEVLKPYLNKCNSGTNHWKHGYYKVHIDKRLFNVHWLLARAFVPGYEYGLVAHHIDGDSTNNIASNLKWITRSENIKEFWNSLSEEDLEKYKKSYTAGVTKAHKEGKYKKHLKNINKYIKGE